MVGADKEQAAPVRQHRSGPRQKEHVLLMPSFDPMGAPSLSDRPEQKFAVPAEQNREVI
jgi:hypothetical protein